MNARQSIGVRNDEFGGLGAKGSSQIPFHQRIFVLVVIVVALWSVIGGDRATMVAVMQGQLGCRRG